MVQDSNIEFVDIPQNLCDDLLQYLRRHSGLFRRVNVAEEPPLRMLSHGLYGECLEVAQGQQPQYPYMIKSDKLSGNGINKFFHAYRFDQKLCEEHVHATEELEKIFGPGNDGADNTFRQVMGYCSGNQPNLMKTSDDPALDSLFSALRDCLSEHALRVYNLESQNTSSASLFSVYANIFLPGQLIEIHLDVPEFLGVDRSKCPSWLLVAAHCSGLFQEDRVKNVTCVLYPTEVKGGALGVYSKDSSKDTVVPVSGGNAVAFDADSHYHHSERVRKHTKADKIPDPPQLPETCSLEVEGDDWKVKDSQGNLLFAVPEKDVRFSVSVKFHVFANEDERRVFAESKKVLTPETIIEVLSEDLKSRGLLPSPSPFPLHALAPLLFKHYILPGAPSSSKVHNLWK